MELQVFFNGYEWVIAESPEEAHELWWEYWAKMGARDVEKSDYSPADWTPCDPAGEMSFAEDWVKDDPETKTYSDWATEKGKGWFATTEF